MKTEINWWNFDDDEILLLEKDYSDFIIKQINIKYKNINTFRLKLNIGREIYQSLKYKKQGINNLHLRKILEDLGMGFSSLNDKFAGIGKFKNAKFNFPIKINPFWACLLSHSFFDGYADKYIMRYSNYDMDNRKEFSNLIEKLFGNDLIFNNPKNYTRDIDLPAIVPRLLMKFFDVKTFYSDKCRIPKPLFELTKINNEYGFYFLKGAYIDEGSVSGGQIWIVRGIKNKPLANDVIKLCRILDIECRLKFSSKALGGYSVGVKAKSFDTFFDNLEIMVWNKNKKISRLEELIKRSRTPLERDSSGRFKKR